MLPGPGSGVSCPSGVLQPPRVLMLFPVIENPACTVQVCHFTHFCHACTSEIAALPAYIVITSNGTKQIGKKRQSRVWNDPLQHMSKITSFTHFVVCCFFRSRPVIFLARFLCPRSGPPGATVPRFIEPTEPQGAICKISYDLS